mgnify:CR=1 FL=1
MRCVSIYSKLRPLKPSTQWTIIILMEPIQSHQQPQSDSAFLDEFRIIKTLGSGYHAKVKLAVKDGKEYAIKRFKIETADLSVLEHELTIMKKLEHNNIVRLHDVRKEATYRKQNGC